MLPFLSTYLKNFSAIQNKQVFRLLRQMRDTGEISTAEGFREKLEELSEFLGKDKAAGILPFLIFSNGELLESDAFRTFMSSSRLDMDTLLAETESLSNTLRAHIRFLTDNYFESLESSIRELEMRTRAFEVLEQRKWSGFDEALAVYDFKGGVTSSVNPSSSSFTALFSDRRTGTRLEYSPPRAGGEGLHLALDPLTSRPEPFYTVELLTDATTPQTAFSVAPSDHTPLHVIDNNVNTFWKKSVLLERNPPVCNLKLGLVFPGPRRVNSLLVSALADVPMKIRQIEYIDEGGERRDIRAGSYYTGTGTSLGLLGNQRSKLTNQVLPNEDIVIPLGDITARKIILTLQQSSGVDGEFFYIEGQGEWVNAGYTVDFESLLEAAGVEGQAGKDLAAALTRDRRSVRRANFWEYVFGLRRVTAFSRDFKSTGVFVPSPFETPAISTLGLYADYELAEEVASCQFLLLKENYDASGNFLDVETLPIPPFGATGLSEYLPLTMRSSGSETDNVGVLRFYPDFREALVVRESGRTLTVGSHYMISVDGGTTWESTLPPTGAPITPWTCRVRILSPDSSEIYTVEYTPLGSGEGEGSEVWMNPEMTAYLERDFTIVFDNQRPSGKVYKSFIALQCVIRSNSRKVRESSYIREVVLLGGRDSS
jgi:hypothetical protein